MDENRTNRMAEPTRRRGPQQPAPPVEAQRAEIVDVPQPALTGIRCPACGRGMVPRRDGTRDGRCYAHCTLCSARMVIQFDGTKPSMVRLVR